MALTCLSRTLDIADYPQLEPELKVVGQFDLEGQHRHRKWEYAIALHAIGRWTGAGHTVRGGMYDIGHIGPFQAMLADWTYKDALAVQPNGRGLSDWCTAGVPLVDVVTCLSGVEKVPEVEPFLYHLSCLLAPGGLLVLTMPYWNRCGADTAMHAEERKRIYCPKLYAQLRALAQTYHLNTFGGMDPTYHGAHIYDYSTASLVLEKWK